MGQENTITAEEIQKDIQLLMSYVGKIRDMGAIDLFSRFFQADYRILNYLRTHTDVHPSIIAESLHLTRPNVAANLRLLESKNFISRIGDVSNHRQVIVNITQQGQRYLSLVDQQCATLFMGWFAILGKEEIPHLFRILELSSDPKLMTDELRHFSLGE